MRCRDQYCDVANHTTTTDTLLSDCLSLSWRNGLQFANKVIMKSIGGCGEAEISSKGLFDWVCTECFEILKLFSSQGVTKERAFESFLH